ncbi:MAG TPA: hypothetical protein PL096_09540 [Micropepsaceae bacterium]|nr:hypothetical protein [Micropepsaceae bacterium]
MANERGNDQRASARKRPQRIIDARRDASGEHRQEEEGAPMPVAVMAAMVVVPSVMIASVRTFLPGLIQREFVADGDAHFAHKRFLAS